MDRIRALLRSGKIRAALLGIGAVLLLVLVFRVFFSTEGAAETYVPTERESRICRLLEEVEGVKRATVMVTEEEGVAVSAIVVFEGADSILTRMRVLGIVSSALRIDGNKVQVYPAEK